MTFEKSAADSAHNVRTVVIAGLSAVVAFGTLTAAFALPKPSAAPIAFAREVVAEIKFTPTPVAPTDEHPFVHQMLVEPEDTLSRLFSRGGISDPEVLLHFQKDRNAIRAARQIRPGQTVQALMGPDGELLRVELPTDGKERLTILREATGLSSVRSTPETESVEVYAAGTVEHSLLGATDRAGVPDNVAVQVAEIFSGEIDFHRDIRQGDRFAVVYERILSDGKDAGSGRVLAASYTNAGKTLIAIRYEDSNGKAGYYAPDGQSMKRAFLRSPLEFSRITSRFTGSRFHPVLKKWRAHKGVDYGAPIGTPVRATADGIVDFVGVRGGYGRLVVIRHTGNRSTAYGHLSGYAKDLRRGSRVEQGQTIAYVGKSGLASGPHLHYEFRVSNQAVNPLTATIPDAPPLRRAALEEFAPMADRAKHQLALADRISPVE